MHVGGGGDGGAWLDGDAARAFTCDAFVTPVVLGEVKVAHHFPYALSCYDDRPPTVPPRPGRRSFVTSVI